MVDSADIEHRITALEAELRRAADEEAVLAQRFDTARSRRMALDQQLRDAREEVSCLTLAATLRESERLLNAADERLRTAQSDAAGRLAKAEAEHDALIVRLQNIEQRCDDLSATISLIAEISVEAVKTAPESRQHRDRREDRLTSSRPDSRQLGSAEGTQDGGGAADSVERQNVIDHTRGATEPAIEPLPADRSTLVVQPLGSSKPGQTADGTTELTVIIDDRDPERSRRKSWFSFTRENRVREVMRARHDEALAARINRVLLPGNTVTAMNAEEVEARIRNMAHGTNGL